MQNEKNISRESVRKFKQFRSLLYAGDPLYSGSAEFVLDMLLYKSTAFARSCDIRPVAVEEEGKRQAQCLYIIAPDTDFAQIAFFDCKKDCPQAAQTLLATVKKIAAQDNMHRIVAGLCGHLSYGVGILNETACKNTFDTCYNKTYYGDYFSDFAVKHTMSCYRAPLDEIRARLHAAACDTQGFTVRDADFSRFKDECENLRRLSDGTIGQTYLYAPTKEGHYYDLLKDLKILLRGQNLLFLQHEGRDVGFVFWHPDYNGAAPSGKPFSAFSFACAAATKSRKIDAVKFNAIGVLAPCQGKGTYALLNAFSQRIGNRFRYFETNFVWDSNTKSALLNRRLVGNVCRKFTVYEDNL